MENIKEQKELKFSERIFEDVNKELVELQKL